MARFSILFIYVFNNVSSHFSIISYWVDLKDILFSMIKKKKFKKLTEVLFYILETMPLDAKLKTLLLMFYLPTHR